MKALPITPPQGRVLPAGPTTVGVDLGHLAEACLLGFSAAALLCPCVCLSSGAGSPDACRGHGWPEGPHLLQGRELAGVVGNALHERWAVPVGLPARSFLPAGLFGQQPASPFSVLLLSVSAVVTGHPFPQLLGPPDRPQE